MTRSAVLWGGVLGVALCVISSPAAQQNIRPNVLLVTLDTVRADRLGAYGYTLGETPVLDRLAREGVRFADATSQSPLTARAGAVVQEQVRSVDLTPTLLDLAGAGAEARVDGESVAALIRGTRVAIPRRRIPRPGTRSSISAGAGCWRQGIEALAEYQRAVEHNPSDSPSRGRLVGVAMNLRRFDVAEPHLQTLLRLNYQPARTHYALGRVAEARGDRSTAAAEYRRALVLDPGLQQARQALNALAGR